MAATQKKKQQEAPAPQVEARIDRMVDGDYKTKAYASVTIAGAFAVHGLRVIETDKGRFISMPQESYKKNGETVYNDTFHAVTAEARTALVDAVNDAYEQRLQERMEQSEDAPAQGMEQQKISNGNVEYTISGLSVELSNNALSSGQSKGYTAAVEIRLEVPVRFLGNLLPAAEMMLHTEAKYVPVF